MRITVNGVSRPAPDDATIADVLAELRLRVDQVAVERNLELVPKARFPQERLAEGDALEIVTMVGGGAPEPGAEPLVLGAYIESGVVVGAVATSFVSFSLE